MLRVVLAALVAFGAALAVGVTGAGAQTYPSQPIHMVVPFPPGGGTDALARAIQDTFQKAVGQTVIIDNRGGGGGSLGHEIVAKAQPDGYTVLVSSNNQMLLPYLIAHLNFDPATFVPIGFIAKQESVFVGSADAPWKDLKAITEAAAKAPGDVQYGTAGISTPRARAAPLEPAERSVSTPASAGPAGGVKPPGTSSSQPASWSARAWPRALPERQALDTFDGALQPSPHRPIPSASR